MSIRMIPSFGTKALAASSVGVPVTGSIGSGALPAGLATSAPDFSFVLALCCAPPAGAGSAFLPSHSHTPSPTTPTSNSNVMRLPAAEPREKRRGDMCGSPW
jgi:hypothetical protein